MEAVVDFIPTPNRDSDKPFLVQLMGWLGYCRWGEELSFLDVLSKK